MSIARRLRSFGPSIISVYFVLTLSILLSSMALKAEMVDRVVAVVNNDVITLSELDTEGETTFRKIAAMTPSANLAAELSAARAEILETLIDKRLINQKAAEKKLTVSEAEIDTAFNSILQRNNMTREQLLAKLGEAGVDEKAYRITLRTQILQNKLVGADVTSKIVVTEEMILDYYDTHYIEHENSGGYYLLQIGCSWENPAKTEVPKAAEHANKTDARKRAERVHDLATSGKDFAELARTFSDLPSKVDGGDIGTFRPDDMAEDMRNAVSGLKPGDVSEIIETSSGYQFFKVLSSGEDAIIKKASYEAVKDSIKQQLFDQEVKKAYAEWVKKLKDQAYIQKM